MTRALVAALAFFALSVCLSGEGLAAGLINRPQLQVRLAPHVVKRRGMETVLGSTTLATSGTVRFTVPGKHGVHRRKLDMGEGGAFLFHFTVGRKKGRGSVRVCVSGKEGTACTRWMHYRVR